jgi:hypothetical protein
MPTARGGRDLSVQDAPSLPNFAAGAWAGSWSGVQFKPGKQNLCAPPVGQRFKLSARQRTARESREYATGAAMGARTGGIWATLARGGAGNRLARAARAMTTAVSKPMADKKTTALAGSDIAHCLSGRLFPSVTAGESRHDRRFAHSRFASIPVAALVPAIRLVRRDLHAQCPLHGFRQPQPQLAPPRSAARRRRASSPGRP